MPQKQKGKKRPKATAQEWQDARQDYVQGIVDATGRRAFPTLEELAARLGVTITTVHRHSKKDDWRGHRAIFEAKLNRDIDAHNRQELAQEAIEFDGNSLKLAKALQADIVRLMRLGQTERQKYEVALQLWHDKQEAANIDGKAFNEPMPPIPNIISSTGINQLASALEKTHKTGRLALGESTENRSINGTVSAVDEGLSEAFDLVRELARRGEGGVGDIH